MEKKRRLITFFWLISLAAVTGLAVAACASGGNLNNAQQKWFGETLRLSGQVYTTNRGNDIGYSPFSGNMVILTSNWSGVSGTGKVEGGEFSMSISGAPTELRPFENSFWFHTPAFLAYPDGGFEMFGSGGGLVPDPFDTVLLYDDLNFSSSGGEYASLSSLNAGGDSELVRGDFSGTMVNLTHEKVEYVYVNKNITITGRGKTTTLTQKRNSSVTAAITTGNISLSLRKGWNAVYTKTNRNSSQPGSLSIRIDMSVADPDHMRWLFY